MQQIAAGIIVYKREKDRYGRVETKYLLLYHGRGYWNFPKGQLEEGERSFQAAIREVAEETGISRSSLRIESNFKTTDKFVFQADGHKIFKIVILFLALAIRPVVKLDEKQEGYAWFTYADAIKLFKHQNSKLILKRANDFLRRKSGARPQDHRPISPRVNHKT